MAASIGAELRRIRLKIQLNPERLGNWGELRTRNALIYKLNGC